MLQTQYDHCNKCFNQQILHHCDNFHYSDKPDWMYQNADVHSFMLKNHYHIGAVGNTCLYYHEEVIMCDQEHFVNIMMSVKAIELLDDHHH